MRAKIQKKYKVGGTNHKLSAYFTRNSTLSPLVQGLSLNAIDVFANVEGAAAKSYVAQLVMTDALAVVGLDAAGQETGVGRHHRDMVEEYGVDATPRCAVILLRAEDAQVKDTSAADGLGSNAVETYVAYVVAVAAIDGQQSVAVVVDRKSVV